jgi:hypothetical protein
LRSSRLNAKGSVTTMKIALLAAAILLPGAARAENIVCPPQNDIPAEFGKWSADYSGSLDEVWLTRQFLRDQEGAVVRCKRTIGSVQIMFQKKSCRIIPGVGKTEIIPSANSEEDTLCRLPRPNTSMTNDKSCVISCK